jgi:hypothetical protein
MRGEHQIQKMGPCGIGSENNTEKQDRGTALQTSLTVYGPEKNPRNTEGHSASNISQSSCAALVG